MRQTDRIAELLHYPQCWDTAAYPTLEDAMVEVAGAAGCSGCKAQSAIEAAVEAAAPHDLPSEQSYLDRGGCLRLGKPDEI